MTIRLIIGSTAIKRWYPDWDHVPKDLDIITNIPKSELTEKCDSFWDERLIPLLERNTNSRYLNPSCQLTLTISHLPWELKNNTWWKHLTRMRFLQSQGVEPHLDLIPGLHEIWTDVHGSKDHIIVSGQPDKFFTNRITRAIPHDELHLLFNPEPGYKQFVGEDGVGFSREKWEAGSHQDRIRCAVEESQVLAVERNFRAPQQGFSHLVTKSSRGYFNLFCILNAVEILELIKQNRKQYQSIFKEYHK